MLNKFWKASEKIKDRQLKSEVEQALMSAENNAWDTAKENHWEVRHPIFRDQEVDSRVEEIAKGSICFTSAFEKEMVQKWFEQQGYRW